MDQATSANINDSILGLSVPIPEPAPKKPPREMTYRAKLFLAICSLVLLTGVSVVWVGYGTARTNTEDLAQSLFHEVSRHAVTHTRGFIRPAAPIADTLARLSQDGLAIDDSDKLARQLLDVLIANKGLSWVSYGDEKGNFTGAYRPTINSIRINQSRIVNGKTELLEREVQPDNSWLVVRKDPDSGYDPRTRPFYIKAVKEKKLVWLPPYIFFNQEIPGISCATPVFDESKKLLGVISIDFDIQSLSNFIAGLKLSPNAKLFIFTADQALLATSNEWRTDPKAGRGLGRLIFLNEVNDPLLQAFCSKLNPSYLESKIEDDFHSFHFAHGDEEYLASTAAFRVGDDQSWIVGAIAPKSDFLGGVQESRRWAFVAATSALLGAMIIAAALAKRVSGPVLEMIGLMKRVGDGDLEARAEFRGNKEFRELSEAMNGMIADLRDRLRLRHSLGVAMEVQQRLLPQKSPNIAGLDIAGHSTYCDETGGDYYDFLVLDSMEPDELLIVLGDVMGHGVAAALVMAGVRAVLRDRAPTAGGLGELLGHLNRLLAMDLEGTRFMTMHVSQINARQKEYRWASAGHDAAIIYDPATDQCIENDHSDLPLGVMDDSTYSEQSFAPLKPGMIIAVGTDGVWETTNESNEQFGKDRLRSLLRSSVKLSAAEISKRLIRNLNRFRGTSRQTDDITFVIVKVLE